MNSQMNHRPQICRGSWLIAAAVFVLLVAPAANVVEASFAAFVPLSAGGRGTTTATTPLRVSNSDDGDGDDKTKKPYDFLGALAANVKDAFAFAPSLSTGGRGSSSSTTTTSTTPLRASNSDDDGDDKTTTPYDLVVIGAGPVGVNAALSASQLFGKRVALVDAPRASGQLMHEGRDLSLGGPTGLFSKALRDTSKRIKVATLRGMGLREDSVWNEIVQSCVSLASSNAQDMQRQLDMAGVDCMEGFAAFPESGDTKCLVITQEDGSSKTTIQTDKVLLATGSKPFRPGGIPFDDGKRIFDSDTINKIGYLPKSIAITGSGIIAVEVSRCFLYLRSISASSLQ